MLFKLPKFAQFAMAFALCSFATCSWADINTDLLSASNSGELFKINNLLALGADIDTRDQNGMTPLHAAVAYGYNPVAYRTNPNPSAKYKAVVELLIHKGADVNSSGTGFFTGWTPLHAAAEWGFKDAAALLIANGASVNARNNLGDTPLQLATQEGHKEVAELLITNGAKVNDRNNHGLTPLFRAVSSKRKDVVELLIAKGADVNEKVSADITPLHVAAQQMPVLRGDEDIILMLIRSGANVNAKNTDGQIPFDVALRSGNNQFSALFSPEFIGSKPSFDCNKAAKLTYIESEICSFPPLAAFDRKLNDSYVATLKVAKNRRMVKDEQRSWLNNRNKICNQHSTDCSILSLMEMYRVRIEQLNNLERNPSIDDDLDTIQQPKAPLGATPEERISFLRKILQRADSSSKCNS